MMKPLRNDQYSRNYGIGFSVSSFQNELLISHGEHTYFIACEFTIEIGGELYGFSSQFAAIPGTISIMDDL